MNIIREERQNIINENNIAQNQLLGILEKLDKNSVTLEIHDALHGNLDFSVLKTEGFIRVKSIVLTKGEVTAIHNLPASIEKLVCDDQYIIDLENLPANLEELSCQHNYISSIDVSKLAKLKVLNVSHNQLEKLENLPESLKELYADDNKIKVLNLQPNTNLTTLHTSNNKAIIIEYLPESVIDFKSENNPFIEIQYAQDSEGTTLDNSEQKVNYIEALHDYFKLKKQYDDTVRNERRAIYKSQPTKKMARTKVARYIPKCMNCKRPGGTVFTQKDRYYKAHCGVAQNPCALKISIFNGTYYDFHSTLYMVHDQVSVLKEEIIKHKLNTLFSYISNEESAKVFKELMEEFTYYSSEHTGLVDLNNKYFYNDNIRNVMIDKKMVKIYELIDSIKVLIDEYEKTNNSKLLETAIKIQVDELNPEIINVRNLRYKIMEMNAKNYSVKTTGESEEGGEEYTQNTMFELYQRYPDLQQIEYRAAGEAPRVVSYTGLAKE